MVKPFPSVVRVGGRQPDVGAFANMLAAAGIVGPDGRPISEACTFGIAGGIGFLYGVFVYGDEPTMTIVGRNTSMPNTFVEPIGERLGIEVVTSSTGGAKKASKQLDAMIEVGAVAVCMVGSGGLPHAGLPAEASSMSPSLVGVVGSGGGDLLLDDRGLAGLVIDRNTFDSARSAYKQGKHLLISVAAGQSVDWEVALPTAIAAGAAGFNTPPVPQFASNIGLAGLQKFAKLLATPKDPKSWAKVFPSGRNSAIGLTRLVDCITYDYSSQANSRWLYAEFLDEASSLVSGAADGAEAVRASAALWEQIGQIARQADPSIAAACGFSDQRDQLLRSESRDDAQMASLFDEKQAAIEGCLLSAVDATEVYVALGECVRQIADIEAHLLDLLGTR